MENAICMSPVPDFMGYMRRLTCAATALVDSFRTARERREMRLRVEEFLDLLPPLIEGLPKMEMFLSVDRGATATQAQLAIDFMLRDILSLLGIAHAKASKLKFLPGVEYKKLRLYLSSLRNTCNHLGKVFISRYDCPDGKPVEKFSIGHIPLRTPIRIFIEDDDTGKYVSCLEIPQLYGFGETEQEALDMLDREILSLRDDVREANSVAEEYQYACELIDMALGHE